MSQDSPTGQTALLRIEIYGPPGASVSASPSQPDFEQKPAPERSPEPERAPAEALPRALARREEELERRERAITGSEGLLDAGVADVERRERKLAKLEAALRERLQDLDEREAAVETREIELEAAFGLREDRVETRESELAELDSRLRRKEDDLARYVGQVQAQFAQRS